MDARPKGGVEAPPPPPDHVPPLVRDFYDEARVNDVHIRHVRGQLEPIPKNPRYVLTVRGAGYKFSKILAAENHH